MSKQLVCQTLVLGLLLAWPAGSPADELKPTSPISPGYRLAWHDEFDGDRLDTEKWTYRIDTRFWSVQLAQNVSVADGCLRLALKKEKQGEFDYTAGGVISRDAFQYGSRTPWHSPPSSHPPALSGPSPDRPGDRRPGPKTAC